MMRWIYALLGWLAAVAVACALVAAGDVQSPWTYLAGGVAAFVGIIGGLYLYDRLTPA